MLAIARRAASLVDAEAKVPLSLHVSESDARHPARAGARLLLELTSRGDRAPVELWLPAAGLPAPVVFLQYGAGGHVDEDHLHAVGTLLEAGLAVATLDWPLHGRRASPKLGGHLLDALEQPDPGPGHAELLEQFALQAALDLSRSLDAVSVIDGVDGAGIALAGVGLGATLVALLAAIDPRPAALVLAPTRRGTAPARLETGPLLAAGRARPVLVVASRKPPAAAPSEVEALRQACPGEARIEWATDAIEPMSPAVAATVARFAADALGRGEGSRHAGA
jgi:hypothetical protein